MIGLLDPALFLARSDEEVEADLALVNLTCTKHRVDLVPLEEYWSDLWGGLGRELERTVRPETRQALVELRQRGDSSTRSVPPLRADPGKVWLRGFTLMFGSPWLEEPWEMRMASAAVRAVASGERVILLSRRVANRNVRVHAAGNSTLHEVTRWMLHVQPATVGAQQVLCVSHPRHVTERWTARFDWRLPADSHRARYPFCPPDRWWKGATTAVRTVKSKPAYVDRRGNGWARPNIPQGAGYHWDVFLENQQLAATIGVDQINVAAYGSSDRAKAPGDLHHVPDDKKPYVRDVGWTC